MVKAVAKSFYERVLARCLRGRSRYQVDWGVSRDDDGRPRQSSGLQPGTGRDRRPRHMQSYGMGLETLTQTAAAAPVRLEARLLHQLAIGWGHFVCRSVDQSGEWVRFAGAGS